MKAIYFVYKNFVVMTYRFLIKVFLWWRWQDKITELCYLWGFPITKKDFSYFTKEKIKHIIFVGKELDYSAKWLKFFKKNGIKLYFFEVKDRYSVNKEQLEEIYKIYELNSFNKEKSYFHCTYGQGRSFMALAYCLIKNKIKSYWEITEFVKQKRKQVAFTRRQKVAMDEMFG